MVRVVVYCTKLIVALITALVFASCNSSFLNGVQGNGNVTTEKREIKTEFTGIEASTGLEVEVSQGDAIKVEVETDSNLQPYVITKVEGSLLKLYVDHNINNAEVLKVYVTLPNLKKVDCNSGSNVHFNTTIKGTHLDLNASSGSHLEGKLEYDTVKAETTSGSSMDIKGIALELNTSSSSGSTLEADQLVANAVQADASSGSSIRVQASLKLNASASSGASVHYSGKATSITKDESSGGSVSKIE
ncbi:MAG: hypothetical protein RLZZ500_226 [Bacteroidota bacterium]|jgi:hypothetical protein